jgi:hypothetical protein
MSQIPANLSINLVTRTEGVQPYNQCQLWDGTYTPSGTATSQVLPVLTTSGSALASGTPYFLSASGCAAGPTGKYYGTLYGNNFTGSVSIKTYTTDALGAGATSNTLSYTFVPASASGLLINAGPDASTILNYYTLSSATVTGGATPYTYSWTVVSGTGAAVKFTPGIGTGASATSTTLKPSFTGMNVNGTWSLKLMVTDGSGATGSDNISITRTGAPPPLTMGVTVDWGTWNIDIFTGTSPYNFNIISTVDFYPATAGSFPGPDKGGTTEPQKDCPAGASNPWRIEVTDASGQTVSATGTLINSNFFVCP